MKKYNNLKNNQKIIIQNKMIVKSIFKQKTIMSKLIIQLFQNFKNNLKIKKIKDKIK